MADVPHVRLSDGAPIPQLQLGNVVIPKSVTPSRVRENFDILGFELSEDDLAAIARLDAGHRTGPDPSTFGAS